MRSDMNNQTTHRKKRPTLSVTNRTQIALELNLGLCNEKLMTSRLKQSVENCMVNPLAYHFL